MNNWLMYAFALIAGILNMLQSGTNGKLNEGLQQPVISAIVVYIGGIAGVLLVSPFMGLSFDKALNNASQVPWWGWLGGILASVYVVATLTISQKMGAGAFTAVTLTASVIASILLDHFGLVGFEVHKASIPRIVGGLLMIGGVIMVAKY